jgi:AmmeMemoRadiSam system protein A/AmmeMemoRadiSam system protein B
MKRQPSLTEELSGSSGFETPAPQSAIVCAVLLPHAPILVPEVGAGHGAAALASCRAMRHAAASLVRHEPESVILISPHSPRQPESFGIWEGPLTGSLERFNAPQARVDLPRDADLAAAISDAARARGLDTWAIRHQELDHGAVVPLWFLQEAGWFGRTVILGLNHSREGGLTDLGQALADAAQTSSRRVAIVASGDMSHRLKPDAPCGFHPSAHLFDEMFIEILRRGNYHELETMDSDLRRLAAEDAVDSTRVAVAAGDWQSAGHEVLNYEGPFGVGYGVAVLFDPQPNLASEGDSVSGLTATTGEALPGVARAAVTSAMQGRETTPPAPEGEYLRSPRGVFVTIRQANGGLRGCVGTFAPVCANLVAETWRSAQLAAFKDTRFPPVTAAELPGLHFEVSVLHPLERVESVAQLDPKWYGVLVSTNDGRRGLLLPNIPGIRTAAQQFSLACEKGWIDAREHMTIHRFTVDHFAELEPPPA